MPGRRNRCHRPLHPRAARRRDLGVVKFISAIRVIRVIRVIRLIRIIRGIGVMKVI